MDSKYSVNRVGAGLMVKFTNSGITKPVLSSKKALKKKKLLANLNATVSSLNGTTTSLNGKVATIKNSPLIKNVPKSTIIDDSAGNVSLLQHRKALPVYQHRKRIVEEVQRNECLIFLGETGSGKTTQIPQYLLEGSSLLRTGVCAVTQPRRMAAISIAQRVAQEQKCKVGGEVG